MLGVGALALSAGRLTLLLAPLAFAYAAFFSVQQRIPVVARPPLLNAVFLVIPCFAGLLRGYGPVPSLLVLGAFFWLSAVGQDYAHAVHGEGESHPEVLTVARAWGPRRTAVVGLGCYVVALAVGSSLVVLRPTDGWRMLPYLFGLVLCFVALAPLLVQLIIEPCRKRARPLYVGGVVFFLVPSVLLGLEAVLGI